jgi:hypothetical protein
VSVFSLVKAQEVVLKLDFLEEAIKATIVDEDDGNLIIKNAQISGGLAGSASQLASSMTEARYYVPKSRVQYVMARAI